MVFRKPGTILILILVVYAAPVYCREEGTGSPANPGKSTVSLGIAPYASISSFDGPKGLGLFLETALVEHLHLHLAAGTDLFAVPIAIMGSVGLSTRRDWGLAAIRYYSRGNRGWLFGTGMAEGSIEKVEKTEGIRLLAEADFHAQFIELGWASKTPFYFTIALRLARMSTSNEREYAQVHFFESEEFHDAKVFSHIVFEFGGYIF